MNGLFQHQPVLLHEVIAGLNIDPHGTYVDGTIGGAGHSTHIAHRLSAKGCLIGLDQDGIAIDAAEKRLKKFPCRLRLVKRNFRHLSEILDEFAIETIDGVLFDIGVSSYQLDAAERGFSYHQEAALDMRMDEDQPLSAYHIVNQWEAKDLARILSIYGEEKFANRIARAIAKCREDQAIKTTTELAEIIKKAIPAAARRRGPHPARRSFQAIRIAVNDELRALEEGLQTAIKRTRAGGRICVITFHSLEDRIVKETFREWSQGCTCPPDFPVCVCERKSLLRLVNRKPIVPSKDEINRNPRARSAKLRIAEKLKGIKR